MPLADLILLETETGDFAMSQSYLTRIQKIARRGHDFGNLALIVPVVAHKLGDMNQLEIAESAAATVFSSPSPTSSETDRAKGGLAMIGVLRGDSVAATEYYELIAARKGTMLFWVISVDRLLGLLSQTIGNLDQAAEHFIDALEFCRKAGYRPELAWTCHDYADMLLSEGASSQTQINSLWGEALSIASELGMPPLMKRIKTLQERADAKPIPEPAYPDGLSQREVEVLRLIAAGKSNREIAEDLFISPNTAGHHVSNLLNKTGSSNRVELATYANRQRLVS